MRLSRWACIVGMCLVGCGSSNPEGAAGGCGGGACGGDLRGTWNIVRGCYADSVIRTPACDGKLHEIISNVHESGTVTFNADGTFRTFVTTVYDDARITRELHRSRGS